MAKEQRSTKWTFLFYEESAPEDYLNILEELHIPLFLVRGTIRTSIDKQESSKITQTWCILL